MKSLLAGLLLVLTFSAQASDQGERSPELATRLERYYSTYLVNPDGSYVENREWSMKVLKERAVESAKQASITYSTSIQKAEVLEAYTLKADGKRINSPKENFQLEVSSGKEKDAPAFSDMTTLSVVFPDVAVGDSVVFSYKLTATEPIFPKHFSTSQIFSRSYPADDVRVKFDLPTSLWVQYDVRELKETITEKDGRKVIEWAFSNKQPIKDNRKNYSVYDSEKEPGYAISTFHTYAEIAEAYGVRARTKAVVTEHIQKLADDITKGAKTPLEQAKALYEWVATNISYAGNCIGIGAVVPRDIPYVLDNKMGDCKDHATLLQALLVAKGISNTQALVNAGSSYRLPKIPVVSMVNHVINYIPSLNLYVDSTSDSTPFGMLPFSDADKPILLVDGYKDGTKTPVSPLGANQQHMKTNVKIKPDGSISADVEVALKGSYAVRSRASFRDMPKDQDEEIVKNVLKSSGYIGSGKFEKEDQKALLDTYKYKAKFDAEEFIQRPGAGAFHIRPLFFSEAPVQRFLSTALEPEEAVEFTCSSGTSTEEYVYQFPTGMKILAVPDDMNLNMDTLAYKATYRLKGDTLTVTRSLEDKTHGNVCSPAVFSAYKKFAAKVLQNLKAQVVYQ